MSIKKKTNSKNVLNSVLFGMIIPQFCLIFINIRSWVLIRGEANQSEASYALTLFSSELSLVIITSLIFCLLITNKIKIGWKISLASLFAHATYMWFFIINIENIIPNTIQQWILNEENVGRWNITLLMPGAFLSLYMLSLIHI